MGTKFPDHLPGLHLCTPLGDSRLPDSVLCPPTVETDRRQWVCSSADKLHKTQSGRIKLQLEDNVRAAIHILM